MCDDGCGCGEVSLNGGGTVQGVQGIQGYQGIQGFIGQSGPQGTTGAPGAGSTGPQGPSGIQGMSGMTGLGVQGIAGIQGARGTQGFSGLQGIIGLKGDQGIKGDQGNIGIQGVQGIQGTSLADTGWINLNGFTYYPSGMQKPQARRIGSQVFFRGDVIVPLSSDTGATLIPLTSTANYVSQAFNQVYTGTGGCNVNPYGSIQFNNNTSVVPSSVTPANFDDSYKMQYVGTRQILVSDEGGTVLSCFASIIVTATKQLWIAVNFDLEDTIPSGLDLIGSSALRFITSNVRTGEYVPNYLNSASEIHSLKTNGLSNLKAQTTFPTLTPSSYTYLFDCDASNEDQIGGFVFTLDGLTAFTTP